MKYSKERQKLDGITLSRLPEYWETESKGLDPECAACPHRYERSHASRARKWIAIAVHGEKAGAKEPAVTMLETWQDQILLRDLLGQQIDELAAEARARYLSYALGVDIEMVRDTSSAHGHAGAARKGANNVAESVRRALRFLAAVTTSRYGFDTEVEDRWRQPLPSRDKKYGHGMRLYRQIVRWHRAQGIGDPADATAASVARASQPLLEGTASRGLYGPWNTLVRQMRAAVSAGVIPGLEETQLRELGTVHSENRRKPTIAISVEEAIKHWPTHFVARTDRPEKLDETKGLIGFFNKDLGPARPAAPHGRKCPRNNLNGFKGRTNRIASLKRYLGWWLKRDSESGASIVHPLEEYFTEERLTEWFQWMVQEAEVLTVHHTHEYFHATYTSRLYFGHDIPDFISTVEEEYDLATPGNSDRGVKAVKTAGSPGAFIKWAKAFGLYASQSAPLSSSRNSGHFLPRKSMQLHLMIRCETGLRPENVSSIRYADKEPAPGVMVETLYPLEGEKAYALIVPKDRMKQHKRKAKGAAQSKSIKPPYRFKIVRPDTIEAVEEYLASWKHAKAVVAGKTTNLFLNSRGEAFRNTDYDLGSCHTNLRARVVRLYKRRAGIELPLVDLYAHRHVIGEFLNRHVPGGKLKTWYLTHCTGKGSDKEYGDHDAKFLRQCISEVLDGVPPLHEQERTRLLEAEVREKERSEREEQHLAISMQMAEQLSKMQSQLESKDRELDQLRARMQDQGMG